MAHIHDSIMINAPVDKVFAVGRDPRRWDSWWVNLHERRVHGDGSTGSRVDYDYLVAGLQVHLRTKVLKDRFEADGTGHWRGTIDGEMRGEQRWDFSPWGDGTLVTADVDYTLPEEISRMADPGVVERLEERAIHQTLENLKFMFEH